MTSAPRPAAAADGSSADPAASHHEHGVVLDHSRTPDRVHADAERLDQREVIEATARPT